MSAAIYYRQCVLKKHNQTMVSWLPEYYCSEESYVKIKINNQWEDGWQIIEVGLIRMEQDDVSKHSQDYKHQRKASDI